MYSEEYVWTKDRRTAPFDKATGSLESYAMHDSIPKEVSKSFRADLLLVDFDKGWRSAHRVVWEDTEGVRYPMFISEFLALVKRSYVEPLSTFPSVSGEWQVVKRGANYGISYVGK